MSQIYVDRRSDIGIAEDTRNYMQRLRRREIWSVLQAANVPFPTDAPKDALVKLAVKHNVNFEKAPRSDKPIIAKELSIHDLRKQVMGLDKGNGEKWQWNEITKQSKDQLKEILNGDNAASRG